MSDEDGLYFYDPDTGRGLTINPFGIALYQMVGDRVNGSHLGIHQGVTGDDEAARIWAHGGPLPADLVVVYP